MVMVIGGVLLVTVFLIIIRLGLVVSWLRRVVMIARSSGFVTDWVDFNPAHYFGLKPKIVRLGGGVVVHFRWIGYSRYVVLVGLVFDGVEGMIVLYERVYDAYNALEDYFESQHDTLDMLE